MAESLASILSRNVKSTGDFPGNWERVATNVVSSDTNSMGTDNIFSTTYTAYKLIGRIYVDTDGAEIDFRFRQGGGQLNASGSYYNALRLFDASGGSHAIYQGAQTEARVWNDTWNPGDSQEGGVTFDMDIYHVLSKQTINGTDATNGSNTRPILHYRASGYNNANNAYSAGYGMIRYNVGLAYASTADGLMFLPSTGNIRAGSSFVVYGLKDQ